MNSMMVLSTASILGALSFFEPCTIATHTIFSVRLHAQSRPACCEGLLTLWLSRSFLAVGLLTLALWLTTPPAWGKVAPAIMLSLVATVYLLSRLVYIPVPHVEFHKLLPGAERLPQAVKLGLTLPACTLPLFAVVTGLTITLDSLPIAIAAGLLFSSLFTLPTAVTSLSGLSPGGRRLLHMSALATPFLTALLLYGGAAYFWFGNK